MADHNDCKRFAQIWPVPQIFGTYLHGSNKIIHSTVVDIDHGIIQVIFPTHEDNLTTKGNVEAYRYVKYNK